MAWENILVNKYKIHLTDSFAFLADMKPEQERLITVLKDTVTLLCKNSLTFANSVQVQGLICITVDKEDVLVVPVHDSIGQAEFDPCVACGHSKEAPRMESSPNRRKRRHRSSSNRNSPSPSPSHNDSEANGDLGTSIEAVDDHYVDEPENRVKIKKEEAESEDDDLILLDDDIKREREDDSSFISGYMDNSQFSSITAGPQSITSHPHSNSSQPQWGDTAGASTSSGAGVTADAMAAAQQVGTVPTIQHFL
jgi:hypothetical protein